MITNEYYIGESLCANIALDDYNGFRMQDYDFFAELYTERMMIAERICIPKSEMRLQEDGSYYAFFETENMKSGTLNIMITAHIPNSNFSSGYETKKILFQPCILR